LELDKGTGEQHKFKGQRQGTAKDGAEIHGQNIIRGE
jgi:hypothetical protein